MVKRSAQGISDSISTAEALRRSEERFRTVAEWTYDWEYWLAPDGRLLYVSPSCERITGYSRQQFISDPDMLVSIVHPEDTACVLAHLKYEVELTEVSAIEFRIITRDAQVRWISHMCQPVFDVDGCWMGHRASNRDITCQKLAEAALFAERHLLRTLIDSLPDAVYVKDTDSRFVVANQATATLMAAATPAALLGKTDADFYPRALAAGFRDDEKQVLQSGQPLLNRQELGLTATGIPRCVATSKIPLFDETGAVIGIVGVGRDVTRQQHIAGALKRRNQVLELLNQANQSLISTLDPDEMVRTILEEIRQGLSADGCSIWLLDERTGEIVCRHVTGPEGAAVQNWRLLPGQGIVGAVFQTGSSLVVPDTRLDARHFKEVDRQTGRESRTILNVPLKARDKIIGVVQVVDSTPARFSRADLQLVEALATTASIAIENARLYQETERLRQFNQNIVERMDEGIIVQDAAGVILFANPKSLSMLGWAAVDLLGSHWAEIVVPESVPQVEKESDRRRQGESGLYETRLLTRAGRCVPVIASAVPLFENGHFQGALCVYTDITDRKRVEVALEQRARDLELINRVNRSLISSPDLVQMLRRVLEEIREGLDATACSAWLTDAHTGELVCWQSVGPNREQVIGWRLPAGQGIAGCVAETGVEMLVADTRSETRHFQELDRFTGVECRSILAVALATKDAVVAVIEVVDARPGHFTQSDMQLVASLAPTAAMAIENARLYQRAEEAAALEERQRLARDLHDSVTQSLYSLVLQSEGYRRMAEQQKPEQVVEWFAELSQTAFQTLKEMRLLLYELRPVTLREHGLLEALRKRLDGVERKLGIKVDLQVDRPVHLSRLAEEEVFRIAQEALNNAVKHSGASRIVVRLERDRVSNLVELEVIDDGVGFDMSDVRQGMGMATMHERAVRLGATITIESQPGSGTRILLQVAD